jgi:metal-responsive CopG/Arc/MetJ family transcriptional regulator
MGRNKMNQEDKKPNFGITIHPKLAELLETQSEKEGVSKSSLIDNILKEKLLEEENKKK